VIVAGVEGRGSDPAWLFEPALAPLFGCCLLGPLIEVPDPVPNSGIAPGAKTPADAVSLAATAVVAFIDGNAEVELVKKVAGVDIPGPDEPGGRVPLSPPLDEPLPVCEAPPLPLPLF
jgi:hypothetical protein